MRRTTYIPAAVMGVSLLAAVAAYGWQAGSVVPEAAPATTTTARESSVPPEPPDEIADDHFALGEYYFNQPSHSSGVYDLEKARHHYRQSILQALKNAEPIPSAAWYQLGRVDFIENKLDASIIKLEKQLDEHGDAVMQTYYMLGLAYGYRALETESAADWRQAEASFERFVEYAPESPWPRVDLAWIYFSQGKYEEMIPLLEEGLAYTPNHAWLLNTYGLALLNVGDKTAARDAFARALESYNQLSEDDWAQAYSGNDPQTWNRNFALFGETVKSNLRLAEDS